MLPYYHPTSVLLVDDDASFLQSFRFFYGDRFPCQSFQRPGEAVDYLRSFPPEAWVPPRPLTAAQGAIDPVDFEPGDLVLQLRAGSLADQFADAGRFRLPSVAVVDFSMPGMSGIEFLQKIKDLPIRRLMLTGRADERTAIDAFNAGIIDSFFMKQEPNLTEMLNLKIDQLQRDFFLHRTSALASVLSLAAPFLADPAIASLFETEAERLGLVEYAVLTEPQGVLGLKSNGDPVFLHIVDEDQRQAAREIAVEEKAPAALLAQLEAGHVALFPTATGFYSRGMAASWQQFVFPAQSLAAARDWSVATIADARQIGLARVPLTSFDAFLEGTSGSA